MDAESTSECFLCRKWTSTLYDVESCEVPCSELTYAQCMTQLSGRDISLDCCAYTQDTPQICDDCCCMFDQRDTLQQDLKSLEDKLNCLLTSRLRDLGAALTTLVSLPDLEDVLVQPHLVTIKDEMYSDVEEENVVVTAASNTTQASTTKRHSRRTATKSKAKRPRKTKRNEAEISLEYKIPNKKQKRNSRKSTSKNIPINSRVKILTPEVINNNTARVVSSPNKSKSTPSMVPEVNPNAGTSSSTFTFGKCLVKNVVTNQVPAGSLTPVTVTAVSSANCEPQLITRPGHVVDSATVKKIIAIKPNYNSQSAQPKVAIPRLTPHKTGTRSNKSGAKSEIMGTRTPVPVPEVIGTVCEKLGSNSQIVGTHSENNDEIGLNSEIESNDVKGLNSEIGICSETGSNDKKGLRSEIGPTSKKEYKSKLECAKETVRAGAEIGSSAETIGPDERDKTVQCKAAPPVYQFKQCKLVTTNLKYLKTTHKCSKKYTCPTCKYVADNSRKLKQHNDKEHPVTYDCPKCDGSFVSKEFTEHLKTHSNANLKSILPKPEYSPIGSVVLLPKTSENTGTRNEEANNSNIKITAVMSKNLLINDCNKFEIDKIYSWHSVALSNGRIKCDLCKVVQRNKLDFEKHFLIHLHESLPCKYCKITLVNFKHYLKHMLYHEMKASRRKLSCNECGERVAKLVGLQSHMRSAHDLRFECQECNEQFLTSELLSEHEEAHVRSSYFQCDYCHISFAGRSLLHAHLKSEHVKNEGNMCTTCGKQFFKKSSLKTHETRVHSNKSHNCQVCGKILKTDQSLLAHMKIHTNKYPFRCGHCDKGCHSKKSLQEHINNAHIIDKINFYTCQVCDRKFRHYGSYNTHVKWHTDPYPGKCSLCSYKCRYKHLVDIHVRTVHTKETYDCTLCDKKYFAKYLLKRHMSKHTGKYMYNCDYCDRGWNIKAHWRLHNYNLHDIALPGKTVKTNRDFKLVLPELPASVKGNQINKKKKKK